jgi:hypothetical protein
MAESLCHNISNMIIVQRIVDDLSLSARLDEFRLPEGAQLMRNCRFCHPKQRGYIADAHFRIEQRQYYFKPRGIGKHLKKIRKVKNRFFIRHQSPHGIYDILVDKRTIARLKVFVILHTYYPYSKKVCSIEHLFKCINNNKKSQYRHFEKGVVA